MREKKDNVTTMQGQGASPKPGLTAGPRGRRGALWVAVAILAALAIALAPATALAEEPGLPMYRMYNPNSGEHFYTGDGAEVDALDVAGWIFEGVGWYAPEQGDPVYRLYNPYAGEHHYTTSASERDALVAVGWRYEGVGWHSDPAQAVPVWRQYNPNQYSCNHNYTTNAVERDWLVGLGWRDEGVGWYACGPGWSTWVPEVGNWETCGTCGGTGTVSETVLVSGAWDEQVQVGSVYVVSDGYRCNTMAEVDAHIQSIIDTYDNVSWWVDPVYSTVHHDAVYQDQAVTCGTCGGDGGTYVIDVPGHYE